MGATPMLTVTCRVGSTAVATDTASQSRSANATAVGRGAARHDHRELVAAEASEQRVRPDLPGDGGGHPADDQVADDVAAQVVDVLEVVDVDHQQRAAARVDRAVGDARPDASPVRHAGERVVLGEEGQLGPVVVVLGDVADRCRAPGWVGPRRRRAPRRATRTPARGVGPGPGSRGRRRRTAPRCSIARSSAATSSARSSSCTPATRPCRSCGTSGSHSTAATSASENWTLPSSSFQVHEPCLLIHSIRLSCHCAATAPRRSRRRRSRSVSSVISYSIRPSSSAVAATRHQRMPPVGDRHRVGIRRAPTARRERGERGARPAPAPPQEATSSRAASFSQVTAPSLDHDETEARRADDLLRDHAVGSLPQWQARTVDDQRR